MSTKIEWTDKTWNPIIGCSKVSPACDHCYAERMACRLATMGSRIDAPYFEVVDLVDNKWTGKTAFVESALGKPLHWRKPCRVFVGSMTDLFHEDTPDAWLGHVFTVMARTPHITYQILTKRPERMRDYMSIVGVAENTGHSIKLKPWPNIWLGVTVENQEQADKRIPILLDTPAAVRFVSIEPMLGPIDLTCVKGRTVGTFDALADHADGDGPALDWVICGGETGPRARMLRPDWAVDLLMQCNAAGVPFFFKKWGSYKGPEDWRVPGGEEIGGQIVREFPTNVGG